MAWYFFKTIDFVRVTLKARLSLRTTAEFTLKY